MRVKLLLLIFVSVFLLSANPARAGEETDMRIHQTERVWTDRSQPGLTRYFALHWQDERWWVERYDAREGRLQRFVTRESFVRFENALHEIRRLAPQAHEQSAEALKTTLADQPTREQEGRVVWRVENSWNWQWEILYSRWIQDNVKPDFFKRYDIGVDCADVAFAARWIFARIHHLPAASTLAGSGALYSQDSVLTEWSGLAPAEDWREDRLFLAALKYVLDNTYTHTLMRDSYPIRIQKEAFLVGTHHLSLTQDSGHTYLVSALDLSDQAAEPIQVMYSTVPAEARLLSQSGFWDAAQPEQDQGGFLHFRWPERSGNGWVLKERDAMPFFSQEQYARPFMAGFTSFAEAVAVRLNPRLDFKARLRSAVAFLERLVQTRQAVVEKGYALCAREDCGEGTQNYENWSTPSRDRYLSETIAALEKYVDTMDGKIPEFSETWEEALRKTAVRLDGVDYSLGAVVFTWKMTSFSSDPREPLASRWGLDGSAFLGSVRRRLERWRQERARKIDLQGGLCQGPSACAPGSPEWQTWQTFELDERMGALAMGIDGYCDFSPASQCEKLRAQLSADDELRDWIRLSPWLNSDPRRMADERWGKLEGQYQDRRVRAKQTLTVSQTGWGLIRNEDENMEPILEQFFSGSRVVPPDGFSFGALDPESDLVSVERENAGRKEIRLLHAGTGAIEMHLSLKDSSTLSWYSRMRLAISENRVLSLVDCREEPCHGQELYRTYSKTDLSASSIPGLFLLQSGDRAYFILDARGEAIKPHGLGWRNSGGYTPKSIDLETQDYFGGMAIRCENGEDCDRRQYFVRKKDGKVIFPDYTEGTEYLLHVSPNGRWGILAQLYDADQRLSRVELDEKMGVQEQVVLGSRDSSNDSRVCSGPGARYFLVIGADSRKRYFRLTDEGLMTAPLLSDELEAVGGCGEELIVRTPDGERLRKWGSASAIFESGRIDSLAPPSEDDGIRWIIASMNPDLHAPAAHQGLFDLKQGGRLPVLTGRLAPSSSGVIRSGALIRLAEQGSLWILEKRTGIGIPAVP